MVTIGLTDFFDFVIKAGSPKLTKVREVKYREPYSPATDFWKPLRDAIRACPNGETLDGMLAGLTDDKKLARYPDSIAGYRKFLGKQHRKWFPPTSGIWTHAGLEIHVNPELGFEAGESRSLVKLYFKDEEPNKRQLEVIFEIMRQVLSPGDSSAAMTVLDVSTGKLKQPNSQSEGIAPLLRGEAANFIEIWNNI